MFVPINIFLLVLQLSTAYTSKVELKDDENINLGDYQRIAVKRAKGTVVPRPESVRTSHNVIRIDPNTFDINWKSPDPGCAVVTEAIKRYKKENLIFDDTPLVYSHGRKDIRYSSLLNSTSNFLTSLQLAVAQRIDNEIIEATNNQLICDDWPHNSMIESYSLSVNSSGPNGTSIATLTSSSDWGFLRGLETFSQLVYRLDDSKSLFSINETLIDDAPRFKYRGFMMDTSRHFIPVETIKRNLDAMSYNKLNVFHWHIVDDQSFPYVSKKFPQLSDTSAFKPNMIYNQQDIASVLEYARLRGIRVIPEFDTPGHSYSMKVIPRLLTECYDENDKLNGDVGPMDPTKPETYLFMNKLINEIASVFPDQYFHAGGDEVDYSCWASNPNIRSWMNKNNITSYENLEGHYIRRILNIARYYKKVPMVWQEIFDNGAQLKQGTIVHVWKYINDPLGYTAEMTRVTQAGHYALLSSCWYMNYISYGQDWIKFYNCDPQDFVGKKEQYDLVLGGEACIWTEFVDETNIIGRVWPRASTTAERLWSPRDVRDIGDFSERVEQLRCRLKSRGIMAEPIVGPGYC